MRVKTLELGTDGGPGAVDEGAGSKGRGMGWRPRRPIQLFGFYLEDNQRPLGAAAGCDLMGFSGRLLGLWVVPGGQGGACLWTEWRWRGPRGDWLGNCSSGVGGEGGDSCWVAPRGGARS